MRLKMFKNKISGKLSLYFAIALIIFGLIIASVFAILFRKQSINNYKNDLEERAIKIAETMPAYINRGHRSMGGFSNYLQMAGDLEGTDIWIIDENKNLLTSGRGRGHMHKDYAYEDLPANAEELIDQSFTGLTVFSEDFSNILSELTLTVGTPIYTNKGHIIGVVLLHSPVEGINTAISQGFIILIISIILALLVSFLLSLVLSLSFTRPLKLMKNTAMELAEGDYTAKTNISQDDEIGELASTIDILADRLDKASQESDKLETMRREFVANISHELRTPITVIRGSLEALVDKIVTDEEMVENYYEQMLNESKFLQRLVGDLLELSKLQSADFKMEKTEIYISDVIDDVIRSLNQLAQKKNVEIEYIKKSKDCKIKGDYGRIRQMIMIILDNAIKFSPEGEKIRITSDQAKLSIKDRGPGIKKDHLPYIFERFYMPRSEKNKTGTGLGLAIAKQIADRHKIELKAESIEGQGATFIFSWPGKKSS